MKFETPPESGSAFDWQWLLAGDWAALLVLGAVAALLLYALWRVIGNGRRKSECRWRKDKRRKGGALERWICTTCRVDAFTSDGKPPRGCKRGMRDAGL